MAGGRGHGCGIGLGGGHYGVSVVVAGGSGGCYGASVVVVAVQVWSWGHDYVGVMAISVVRGGCCGASGWGRWPWPWYRPACIHCSMNMVVWSVAILVGRGWPLRHVILTGVCNL